MNKEVIYIEPEDDITDIITKIENAKEKIVALVPPKKAGVFRSVVNTKLIAKAGVTSGKTVVLVTIDPSIVKLAAATKLPVTKDLQTPPSIPTVGADIEETSKEDLVEEPENAEEEPAEEKKEETEGEEEGKEEEGEAEEKEEEDKKDKEEKKKPENKKTGNKFKDWFIEHKKLAIFAGIGLFLLILFVVWAFFIAPAVNVFVSIKTDSNNFSELITFVKEQNQENIKEGKLYLEERKIETVNEVEIEPTGQKNIGEKATGELVIYSYFSAKGVNAINAGTSFTISGLSYLANENSVLSWDGNNHSCENDDIIVDGKVQCLISGRINVTAAGAGSKYNIVKSSTGWETVANVAVYSDKEMSGGTDNVITVVQQSDVEKARNTLNSSKESENKEKLYETINQDDNLIIESTYNQDTSAAVATPAVDEEVKDGEKATLKTTTKTSVYTVDKTKLEELIKEKIALPEDKKIFEIRNVYIDGFKETSDGFSGKLKAVYYTGPRITEGELVDKIMGKGIGDARREIKDIEGVVDVDMRPSYPWVMKVPTDSNRISMTFEIKDQEGGEIKEKTDEKSDEKTEEKSDNSENKTE